MEIRLHTPEELRQERQYVEQNLWRLRASALSADRETLGAMAAIAFNRSEDLVQAKINVLEDEAKKAKLGVGRRLKRLAYEGQIYGEMEKEIHQGYDAQLTTVLDVVLKRKPERVREINKRLKDIFMQDPLASSDVRVQLAMATIIDYFYPPTVHKKRRNT